MNYWKAKIVKTVLSDAKDKGRKKQNSDTDLS